MDLSKAIDPQNRRGNNVRCRPSAPCGTRLIVEALRWSWSALDQILWKNCAGNRTGSSPDRPQGKADAADQRVAGGREDIGWLPRI